MPRGKGWSLAQVCEHLALSVRGTVELGGTGEADVGAAGAGWWAELGALERMKRGVMRRGLLWSGMFPKGVPAPAFVLPSAEPDLETMIRELEMAAGAFDRKLAERGARWPLHPMLGPMSGAQWKRFHDLHARHHFGMVR